MKPLFIYLQFITYFLLGTELYAQKHDYNWISGKTVNTPIPKFGLYNLNFSDSLFKLIPLSEADSTKISMINNYHTSFSNKKGILKFFTNGLRVYDASYKTMFNGDTLNPGYLWNKSTNDDSGYESSHGIVAVPDPKQKEKYSYLIHQGIDTSNTWYTALFANPLYYSKIDLDGNNGLGTVIEKNIVIDTGKFEPLSMVKHANGRDWWIIMPEMYYNKYHRLLVTPEGIKGPWVQEIGPSPIINGAAFIINEFSPSGDKYLRGWILEGVAIFDFDRCTGLLSNSNFIQYTDTLKPSRIVFSPSGQYLYSIGGSPGQLMQLDLNNPVHKFIEIAKNIDLMCQGKTNYINYINNAPDGKIYMAGGNIGIKCMSVINEPDKPFPDCNFQHPIIDVPYYNQSFPYFPNYRLGPLIGSGCDTITSTIELKDNTPIAIVYPNPATENITLELMDYLRHNDNLDLSLIDISGKLLYAGKIPSYAYILNIDIKDLAPGIYCILIKDKLKLLGSVKLIKK